MADNNGQGDKIIEFKKCPNCGSKKQFVAELAQKVKDKGLMGQGLEFFANIWQGIVSDPSPAQGIKIPFGSKTPTYVICVAVCSKCGTIYAGRLVEGEATKQLQQAAPKLNNPISLS